MYILDPEEATQQRLNITESMASNYLVLLSIIDKFISDNNELAKAFKMLY